MDKKIKEALTGLLQKYHVKADQRLNLLPGWTFFGEKLNDTDVPLLTWRINRKFIELRKIISDKIVDNVCMLRFCSLGSKDQWTLEGLMYKEFDLCEFLNGGKIVSVHAAMSDDLAGNVIVKMDDGVIGSIEVGIQSPVGAHIIDRHEIITRRGVASDLVVDTLIPQNSIYTYTNKGEATYKDVDNELFGCDEIQTEYIRSAFDVLKNPERIETLRDQHNHLLNLVNTALDSNLKHKKLEVN